MIFKPFKPRPVFGCFLYVSLIFSFVWLVSSTPCFLFSSLRRLGNPNPLRGVWGSPCVSSSWTRSPIPTRTLSSATTPWPRPAPVFFFRRRRFFFFWFGCFLGFCPCVGRFFGCVFGPSLGGCMQDDTNAFRWGRETRHLPPLRTIIITCCFWFWVRTSAPQKLDAQLSAELVSPRPTPFLSNAVEYSPGRGWGWPREGDLGPAAVLSHIIGY